jgi:hypothetical protein
VLPAPRVGDADRVRSVVAFRRGSRAGFARFLATAKAEGTTVGGGFMAAVHFALARHARRAGALADGPVTLPIEVEVNLRTRAQPAVRDDAVGFWVGGTRAAFPVARELPFWTVARALSYRVQEQIGWGVPSLVHHAMDGADWYGDLAAAGIDVRANGGAGALANVSNVGRWPHATAFGSAVLDEVYGLNGCCLGGPAVIAWLRSIDGRFTYDTVANAAVVDRGALDLLQDEIVALTEREDTRSLTLGDWLAHDAPIDLAA